MNLKIALIILLFTSLFFQSTLFSFPFVIAFSIFLYILYPEKIILVSVFITSLLLDSVNANVVGITAIFIFCAFVLLDILRNVFVVKDSRIMLLFIFISSYFYAKFLMYQASTVFYIVLLLLSLSGYLFTKRILESKKLW